jgi:hypothetical protein
MQQPIQQYFYAYETIKGDVKLEPLKGGTYKKARLLAGVKQAESHTQLYDTYLLYKDDELSPDVVICAFIQYAFDNLPNWAHHEQ